jgi:HEAT repeat protein
VGGALHDTRCVEGVPKPVTAPRNAPQQKLNAHEARKRGDIDSLRDLLASTSLRDRRSAVYHLGEMRAERAVDDLVRCLQATDENIRMGALNALAKIDQRSVAPSVFEIATSDSSLWVRTIAAWTLASLGENRRAVDAIVALIGEGKFHTRRLFLKRAGPILVELQAVDTIPVLEEACRGEGIVTRWRLRRAITALRRIERARTGTSSSA